jgi:IS30 family transposase
VASKPDEPWAPYLCRVWAVRDQWAHLALVIDCHTRELLGWHLSRSGRSRTAEAALEQALIARYGCLGRRGQIPDMLRIHLRPPQIEDRLLPDNWVGDLIKGAANSSAVGTIVEHTSHAVMLVKLQISNCCATANNIQR